MAQHQPIRKTTPTSGSDIPDKLYFRIGEVAKLCDVPAYVLRFWESEFPQLKPHKGGTGQRLYRRRDVEMAMRIKSLLYNEGYTIPGARQVFKSELKHREPQLALAIEGPGPSVESAPAPETPEGSPRSALPALQVAIRPIVHPIRAPRTPQHLASDSAKALRSPTSSRRQ